jgi:regulator of ribonuclease activity A
MKTTDLCDQHGDAVRVALPLFRDYGGRRAFFGLIATVVAPEDNSLVRSALEEPGLGRVLVVDGGASERVALLGDLLAELGVRNGWAGVVVNGCIRDSEAVGTMALGVKALGTCPRKSEKKGRGARDVPVTFASLTFSPGEWLYADGDGVIVSGAALVSTESRA